jgi:hypothetical protein
MHIQWLDRAGVPQGRLARRLPVAQSSGVLAQRSDGVVFAMLPELRGIRYVGVRVLGFAMGGRRVLRARLPLLGPTFEGSLASVECGSSMWLVSRQILASDRKTIVLASRVDGNRLAPPVRVAELDLPDNAETQLRFFEGEPMRTACRETQRGAQAAVAFRHPATIDPGSGELVVLRWAASALAAE